MFQSIEEGLQVYRTNIRSYLVKFHQIDDAERSDREAVGRDYCGYLDWTKDAYEWKKSTEAQLDGMKIALGLSDEENTEIWESVRAEFQKAKVQ